MVDEIKMLDFVIYALHESGPNKGSEIKGSAVKLMRFPEVLGMRQFNRYSGPWLDIRLGLHDTYGYRTVEGTKNVRATRKIVEPLEEVTITMNANGKKETFTHPITLNTDTYAIKPTEMSGTLNRSPGKPMPRFSKWNEEYLRQTCLHHFRYGTMKDLDDETGEAVYADELPKLKNLIGKKVFWEFRPYIRTISGAASGVDQYKMQIVEPDEVDNAEAETVVDTKSV